MDLVNSETSTMLATITQKSEAFFIEYGLTVGYLGWAGTFTFSKQIQDAIDRRYVAELQQPAAAEALCALAGKTDGKLPSTIVGLPDNVAGLMQSLLMSPQAVVAPLLKQ